MRDVTMAKAKANLSELANRTNGGERFLLLRRGKPVAALVAVDDLGKIERAEATDDFVAAARRFAAALPPANALPDLADILPPRSSHGRRLPRR